MSTISHSLSRDTPEQTRTLRLFNAFLLPLLSLLDDGVNFVGYSFEVSKLRNSEAFQNCHCDFLEDRYTAVIYFGHRIPVASTNVRLGVAGFAWSSKGLIASQCQVRLAIIFESTSAAIDLQCTLCRVRCLISRCTENFNQALRKICVQHMLYPR